MTSIQPLHDRVVVRRMDKVTETASGIVIPDSVDEQPSQGTVVAVGSGKRSPKGELEPLTVKIDDTIVFGKMSGEDIEVDNETLTVMREEDIIAIVHQ